MKKHKKIFRILIVVMVVALMTGCDTIDKLDFNGACVKCGSDTYFPAYLVKLCANIIGFIQVMVPVIIIIVGMIDLFKAVIASDEKKMSESKDSLIRKTIAGIMIYLVIAIVEFAFTAIPDLTNSDIDVMECISYFLTGPDRDSHCPDRVTGNGIPIWDNDEGYTPSYSEGNESSKRNNYYTCNGLARQECNDAKCDWDNNLNKCVTEGQQSSKSCFICNPPGSQPYYRWEYSNPNTNYCSIINIGYADCNSKNAQKQQKCYKCRYFNSYFGCSWQVDDPSLNNSSIDCSIVSSATDGSSCINSCQ